MWLISRMCPSQQENPRGVFCVLHILAAHEEKKRLKTQKTAVRGSYRVDYLIKNILLKKKTNKKPRERERDQLTKSLIMLALR